MNVPPHKQREICDAVGHAMRELDTEQSLDFLLAMAQGVAGALGLSAAELTTRAAERWRLIRSEQETLANMFDPRRKRS